MSASPKKRDLGDITVFLVLVGEITFLEVAEPLGALLPCERLDDFSALTSSKWVDFLFPSNL